MTIPNMPQFLLPASQRLEWITSVESMINSADAGGIRCEHAVAGIAFPMSARTVQNQQKRIPDEAAGFVRQR
jgi:hypothetical protein